MLIVGWIDWLDRKLGKYSIKNLMLYITILNGVAFILSYLDTEGVFVFKLMLIPAYVMKGEVWRLVTFLFVPTEGSPFSFLITLYFYYIIGSTLEHEWGSFKFNLYYLIGVLGTIGAAFITGFGAATYLNLSLIFAFAYLYPNFQLLLFFFLPVKIKYLAIAYALFLVYNFRAVPVYGLITVAGSILNFLLFFGKDIISWLILRRKSHFNQKSFKEQFPKWNVLHKCTICGRTELEDKNLEFRYCVDCDGDYEYCMDHLYNHEHIKKNQENNQKNNQV